MAKKPTKKQGTKSSLRPIGLAPIWNDKLRDRFGFNYYTILDNVRQSVSSAEAHPNSMELTSLIADIRVLCCLLKVHPLYPRNARFEKTNVAKWRAIIERNLEHNISKIPPKYRDEFTQAVYDDLRFLDEHMDRKRDRANDLW